MRMKAETARDITAPIILPPRRILLLVDDDPNVLRSLSRLLGPEFDLLLTAQTVEDAERLLEDNPVTHLVCDGDLGPSSPAGLELVPRWRRQHASIVYAVIFSGSDLSRIPAPHGVDSLLPKSSDPAELTRLLAETS